MIRVRYFRNKLGLEVRGHAQSGEFGHDLVCAAVSALTVTLADNLKAFEKGEMVTEVNIRLEPGDAFMRCRPDRHSRNLVTVLMDAFCVGYERLAMEYPENISYEVISGGKG